MVVAGGILVVASKATHLSVALVVAGLAVGLVGLLVFAFTRSGRSRGSARRRPAGHRHRAAPSAGPGRERGRVLNPTTVYSPGGLIDVPRDVRASASEGAARACGFSDPPGAARPPGSQGAREPFRAPMAGGMPRGGPSESRPQAGPGRTGAAPPRPGYQAGAPPAPGAGPGWGPPGPAGRPAQRPTPPPPGRVRPGEAFPPRGMPPAIGALNGSRAP